MDKHPEILKVNGSSSLTLYTTPVSALKRRHQVIWIVEHGSSHGEDHGEDFSSVAIV